MSPRSKSASVLSNARRKPKPTHRNADHSRRGIPASDRTGRKHNQSRNTVARSCGYSLRLCWRVSSARPCSGCCDGNEYLFCRQCEIRPKYQAGTQAARFVPLERTIDNRLAGSVESRGEEARAVLHSKRFDSDCS